MLKKIGVESQISGVVNMPVIDCGGAGSIGHFGEAVHKGGASAVAARQYVCFSLQTPCCAYKLSISRRYQQGI